MKTGTPGFNGERLRQAREARGINAITLADILGLTRAAISLYECGKSSPQPDILYKIAEKLNLPTSFFMIPVPKTKDQPVFYRSMIAATKSDRNRGETKIEWLNQIIIPYLKQFVSFPQVNMPPAIPNNNILNTTDDDIETIAMSVRKYWGLGKGPISNMVLLLENNGIIVVQINLHATTLDAFSTWNSEDKTPYIILGTEKESAVRSRFDTAHELGHLILHRNINTAQLNSPQLFKLIEEQANRFASAFLIPMESFAFDYTVPTLNAFTTLKPKWLVSIGMMIKRTAQLGFIDKDQEQRLWINYSRHGWKRNEPFDDKIAIEKPVLINRAVQLMLDAKIKTTNAIIADIPLSNRDIEELMNLPYGFLSPELPLMSINNVSQNMQDYDYQDAIDQAEWIIKNPDKK